jgi:hypothetical protein
MHLHDCPVCSHSFLARRNRRCRKCGVLILHVGEYFEKEAVMFACVVSDDGKVGNIRPLVKAASDEDGGE